MKNEIDEAIAKIDELVKEASGVDLAKLDRQLEATRKAFRGLDLNTHVYDGEIFLIKSRISGIVH